MKLFISYGHGDYPVFIKRLVSDLRKKHEVWVDHELRAGDHWQDKINSAISRSDLLIFVISPRSVREDGFCYNELQRAVKDDIKVIPICLDNTFIPTRVAEIQHIDITDLQYVDMSGSVNILNEINEENYSNCFAKLENELYYRGTGEINTDNYDRYEDNLQQHLFHSLESACDKTIRMKYGAEGINKAYLSILQPKTNLEGFKETYHKLSDLISAYTKKATEMFKDPDIRFLISGDVYMGRTTQLLNYYQESLKDENDNRIIFYIPPYVLHHTDLFTYIYETYLNEFPALREKESPKEAFRGFKDKLGTGRKVVILVDDYDSIPKQQRGEFDRIFKFEDPVIDHVDVIIKIRYKDASWPRDYLEINATGVDENTIINTTLNKKIKQNVVEQFLNSLRSPWFLKLLIDDAADGTFIIGNPGQLIRQNIENHIEAAAPLNDALHMNILRFSAHAILPRLKTADNFNIAYLYGTLPTVVEETINSGAYYEGFQIIGYFHQIKMAVDANALIFNDFFQHPVVETLGLMSDPAELGIAVHAYEWKDRTVGDYFYASAILHLFNTGSKEEAIHLISQLISSLMVLEKPVLHSSVDPSVFVSFDRARYFIDIIDDSVLNKLKNEWPDKLASLYCGLALVYELLGNEQNQYRFSLEALSVLNQMFQNTAHDRGFIARWLHKMAYYVIKCHGDELDNFQESLLSAKECLEKAITIAEKEKPTNLGTLELSKMYGNMGAYYLRQKCYSTAMGWHKKSLETKEQYLSDCGADDKEETEEGIRRSLVSLATDTFYLGCYKESIEYHKKGIEVGKRIQSFFRYESYSRIVGSYIKLYNQENRWSVEAGEELLDLLIEGFQLMRDLINRRELNIIYQRCKEIIISLQAAGFELSSLNGSSLYTKVRFIEDQYNIITWNNSTTLSDYFE